MRHVIVVRGGVGLRILRCSFEWIRLQFINFLIGRLGFVVLPMGKYCRFFKGYVKV